MSDSVKDVLLITNYYHFECEKVSTRYRSFADHLSGAYSLEVVTSTFWHLNKKQRIVENLNLDSLPYKTTLIFEPGYKRNIGLKRIHSYTRFGKNVSKYLRQRKKPDVIILSVPSLAVADFVTQYARKHRIPLILDIQDLWPEAFKMAIDIPVLSDILFYPMKRQAERIYSRADTIMAVSDTYVSHGKKFNPRANGLSIYIGTDPKLIESSKCSVEIIKPRGEFWVTYVGALGHSYDIKSVLRGLKLLKDKGYSDIVFKVIGSGVLQEEFFTLAEELGLPCDFTGQLDYGTMMAYLQLSDVAVNPIVAKSVSTIINKVSDYAAAGLPVINSQNSVEYRRLLEDYRAGINVKCGDPSEIATAIEKLYLDQQLRETMHHNASRMFTEKFDRSVNYPKLVAEVAGYLR